MYIWFVILLLIHFSSTFHCIKMIISRFGYIIIIEIMKGSPHVAAMKKGLEKRGGHCTLFTTNLANTCDYMYLMDTNIRDYGCYFPYCSTSRCSNLNCMK